MKKLLCISAFALALTACSQGNGNQPPAAQQPLTQEQIEQEAVKAADECHQELGANKKLDPRDPNTRAQFDACMSKKGFERIKTPAPANQKKR